MADKYLIQGAINYYLDNSLNPTIKKYENEIQAYIKHSRLDAKPLKEGLEALLILRKDYHRILKEL